MNSMTTNKGWLFILPWPPEAIGGINRVVVELCRTLKREGHYQPLILVLDWSADKPVISEKHDYIEIRYRLRAPSKQIKAFLSFILSLPKTLISLANILNNYHITVVNPHNPILSTIYFIPLRFLKIDFKLLLSIHGEDLKGIEASKGLDRRLWQCLIRHTDAIVGCSKGLSDNFAIIFPDAKSKITYIHNGISGDFLTSISSKVDLHFLPKRYLLSVGTFEHKKGQDLLIDAFAKIAGQFPDLSLVFVGRSSDILAQYKQQTLRLGLCHRVIFFEDISPGEIIDFYRRASLYVSSSRVEPFGIVMLEAGALGVPVLATRTLGAMEIINDGVEGMLVPVDDIDALAQGMTNLLNDKYKRKVYAEALKEKVVSKFTWENALIKYMSLIN